MLGNPDADQVAADVVSFGEPVEGLAGQIVLDDLPLELDRIAAVLGHGLSPRKPGRNSLIRVTSPVHPVGCTPIRGQIWAPIDTITRTAIAGQSFGHPARVRTGWRLLRQRVRLNLIRRNLLRRRSLT